jgi:hypothetical protein
MSHNKVNRGRILKLIRALKSGAYKQNRGRLKRGDNLCVLGVACDIYRKTTGDGRWVRPKIYSLINDGQFFEFNNNRYEKSIPLEVLSWYGFTNTVDAIFPDEGGYIIDAVNQNDNWMYFDELANLLERTYLSAK